MLVCCEIQFYINEGLEELIYKDESEDELRLTFFSRPPFCEKLM